VSFTPYRSRMLRVSGKQRNPFKRGKNQGKVRGSGRVDLLLLQRLSFLASMRRVCEKVMTLAHKLSGQFSSFFLKKGGSQLKKSAVSFMGCHSERSSGKPKRE